MSSFLISSKHFRAVPESALDRLEVVPAPALPGALLRLGRHLRLLQPQRRVVRVLRDRELHAGVVAVGPAAQPPLLLDFGEGRHGDEFALDVVAEEAELGAGGGALLVAEVVVEVSSISSNAGAEELVESYEASSPMSMRN